MNEQDIKRWVAEAVADQANRAAGDSTDAIVSKTVSEVLAEQQRLHNAHADTETLRTINMILTTFGIEEEDRREMRKDFQHLRRWRTSYETVERAGWKAVMTVLVTGLFGLIWLGVSKKILGN